MTTGIIIGIFMKNLNLRHLLGGRLKIKAPRNRADEVSGYWNNAYYIAAPLGGISASLQQAAKNSILKKIVCACPVK